jgi:hypothetical protein
MPRKHTASFIPELPLKTDPADERACAIILDTGRNIGNAVHGEGRRIRESRTYRAARKMSRGEPRSPEHKAGANEFKPLFDAFGLTGHALQEFGQECRDSWIRDQGPGHVGQIAATRALNGILQYAFGKRGRPKCRGQDRYNSFKSKEAKSIIIWRDGAVRIAGRVIPAILDSANAWQSEALKAKTKYCRIIRRDVRDRGRWYLQLVQKGLLHRVTKRGVIGPDIGPSTIAAAAHIEAIFEQFCPSVIEPWKELRRIGRTMDRSKRANNPECIDEKGRWIKGAKMRVQGELIEFGTRQTCLSQFCHLDGTYTKTPLARRYQRFPGGTRGRDLYFAILARLILDNRLDAIQAAQAWTGAAAFLRVASNGFEPASGKGFAFAHATLGVRAGRSKETPCQSPRGWGWCRAGRFASVESPRERRSTAGVNHLDVLCNWQSPYGRLPRCFANGEQLFPERDCATRAGFGPVAGRNLRRLGRANGFDEEP